MMAIKKIKKHKLKPVKKGLKTKSSAAKSKARVKKVVKASPKKKVAPTKLKNKKIVTAKAPVKKNNIKPVMAVAVVKPKKPVVTHKPLIETKAIERKVSKKEEVKISIPTGPIYVKADTTGVKNRVRTVLLSQPKPESDKNPYLEIARKYNLKIDFRQFIKIEAVPAREFRQQRINILDHNAVILTSRLAVDHYFRMCNEMRVNVPESMKYFCISESTAYYLQKYVQFRKRKIFHGQQTLADLVDVIKKHKEEKFLLPVSDIHKENIAELLDVLKINYNKAIFYKTVSSDLSDFAGKLDYDVVVFFTPAGIDSLKKNFPNLVQGNLRIGAFGVNTCAALKEIGLRLDIAAPTIQTPSMTMALEEYIKEANKR